MASTECGNGHLYDPELYASCPYCGGGGKMISFEGPGKTSPLSGGFGPGEPVQACVGRTQGLSGGGEPGATVAPDSYRRQKERESKTVSLSRKKTNLEPVVGWLVCIDGPEKGKDYRLLDKQNTVGRSEEMDVCIMGDTTISREQHARIAYDPRHNNFTLIPAESTNNIYVNDEPAYVAVKIHAFDCIEFGESKFILVPLCCDRFTWQDGLRPEPQG